MKVARIPLQPHSRFHFGQFRVDNNVALSNTSEIAHSDTLFSALISSYYLLNNDANELVDQFRRGLKISSLFHYLKNDNFLIYLLPKPVFLDIYSIRDGNHKLRNKIKYVSHRVWQLGFDTSEWLDESKFKLIQNQQILITIEEFNRLNLKKNDFIFKIVDQPKNPIREVNNDPSIFYRADVEIGRLENVEIGFYLIYDSPEFDDLFLKIAINILAFSGIGGDRSNSGRNMGIPVFDEFIDLHIINNDILKTGYCNLSLLIPKDQSELNMVNLFQTIFRGGANSGINNNKYLGIRMIQEGGLLFNEIEGKIVEIGLSDMNVQALKYGKSLYLPISFKVNN